MKHEQQYKGNAVWGAGVRKLREEAGLSRAELAARIGFELSTSYGAIENGKLHISPEKLERLHKVLPGTAKLPNAPVSKAQKVSEHNATKKKAAVRQITVQRNPGLTVKKSKHAAPVPVMKRVTFGFVVSLRDMLGNRKSCEKIMALIAAAAAEELTLDELNQLFNAKSRRPA